MADVDPRVVDALERDLFSFISTALTEDHPLLSGAARQPVNANELQKHLVKARFPGGFIPSRELSAVLARCPPLGSDMTVNTVQWVREGLAASVRKGDTNLVNKSSPSKAGAGGVGANPN